MKLVTLIFVLTFSVTCAASQASDWGFYTGRVVASWGEDGRTMTLTEDFQYTDPSGNVWFAATGRKVDGASIPPAFWSFIGGPFSDKYRHASVIHDIACEDKSRPWKETHLAFYHAMRCSDVPVNKAKVMYWAVYHFGLRWGINQAIVNALGMRKDAERFNPSPVLRSVITREHVRASADTLVIPVTQATQDDLEAVIRWVEQADPDIKQIESTSLGKVREIVDGAE